jgi:hypothetical protein
MVQNSEKFFLPFINPLNGSGKIKIKKTFVHPGTKPKGGFHLLPSVRLNNNLLNEGGDRSDQPLEISTLIQCNA